MMLQLYIFWRKWDIVRRLYYSLRLDEYLMLTKIFYFDTTHRFFLKRNSFVTYFIDHYASPSSINICPKYYLLKVTFSYVLNIDYKIHLKNRICPSNFFGNFSPVKSVKMRF